MENLKESDEETKMEPTSTTCSITGSDSPSSSEEEKKEAASPGRDETKNDDSTPVVNESVEEEDHAESNGGNHSNEDAPEAEAEEEVDDDYFNSTSSALSEDRWEEMYLRLLEFKEIHGHCLVPNRYKEDLQLGAWVSAQRKNYKLLESNSGKTTPMTMQRAQRLMDVGFEWTAKNPRHLMWEVRFAELRDFKHNYGHAQVPIGWEQNVQLANWVSTQRQEYKNLIKGKTSRLNDNRVSLLNSLGFAWELQRGGRRRRLTVANKGNHPGASGNPPNHPANRRKAEQADGPPVKKAKLQAEDSFAIDDGTPMRRTSTGRKRTTLKKKVTSVDGSSKCILPGVAIMGGGRNVPTPRPQKKNNDAAGGNDNDRSQDGSPSNNNNDGSGGNNNDRPPFQQQQMNQNNQNNMQQNQNSMQQSNQNNMQQNSMQQQQMHPQQAFSNEAIIRMLGGNPNPWTMLPHGAYQQFGMAHQLMGPQGPMGPNPFFPMAPGPFGMSPFGAPPGFDPSQQYQNNSNNNNGNNGPSDNCNSTGGMFQQGMNNQNMGYGRMQQQQGGFNNNGNNGNNGSPGGNNNGPGNNNSNQNPQQQQGQQPYFVSSTSGAETHHPDDSSNNPDPNNGNGNNQNGGCNNNQQQPNNMNMQFGPGGMMPNQFAPGGWGPAMQMGQQGGFWGMNDNAAAAAAAAQHLQAAAALTAGMDERSLPPALAPLASVARQMNGMLGGPQGMNGGMGGNMNNNGCNSGPPQNGGNNGSMNQQSNNGGGMNSNGSMQNVPNITNHVRGRRGDPPAGPPTSVAMAGIMMDGSSPNQGTVKKMRMKQGVYEEDEEN
ncbi:helicase [Seminavis robusta]|uniref:Helicase n=1 Tax=Seminavis robusta TaxID=568900 RepID=A0A9N8DKS5_9STRA|nr:helicase [Seminavis robusta]|eukprot:Sro137_g064350.1 helicase (822) ;mRNA; r:34920-38013